MSVRTSLDDCQWPTTGQSICWLRCEERRFGLVQALSNNHSETIREAMVDVQLLLRGGMGAVDNLFREHAVFHSHHNQRL